MRATKIITVVRLIVLLVFFSTDRSMMHRVDTTIVFLLVIH